MQNSDAPKGRQKVFALPVSLLIGGLMALGHFRHGEVVRAVVVLSLFSALGTYLAFS